MPCPPTQTLHLTSSQGSPSELCRPHRGLTRPPPSLADPQVTAFVSCVLPAQDQVYTGRVSTRCDWVQREMLTRGCQLRHSPQCTSCSPSRSRSGTARSWSSAAQEAGVALASRGRRGHPAGSHRSCEGTCGHCKLPSAGLAIQPVGQLRPLLEL